MDAEACEWQGDIIDDTLKELFISQTMYCDGNREVAMLRLAAQKSDRIPLITERAVHEGAHPKKDVVRDMQGDVQRVINAMRERKACTELKALVLEIDKKHALPNYYRFSQCIHQ